MGRADDLEIPGDNGTELFQSLLTHKILSEDCLDRTLYDRVVASADHDFEALLNDLRQAGKLSDYQLKQIAGDGVDALRFGPYVLLDHLGRGGMGEVLLARHIELDRQVALKILPPRLTSSTERRERFRREIRLLAKLDHPGIVKAIDAGHCKDIPYLAMEYLSGGTLQDVVASQGSVAWNRLVRWMQLATDAIAYAHALGIIHRDIKPSNLAVDEHKRLRVLDLGLARAMQQDANESTEGFMTSANQMLGTVDFMPPEQSSGDGPVLPTADIYSLGCTMFTLLTGRPIFPGSSVMAKVVAHRRELPTSILILRPEVPPELDHLIQNMVAKLPGDRPQTMAQVGDRLKEIAEQYQLADSTASGTLVSAGSSPGCQISSPYQDTYSGGGRNAKPLASSTIVEDGRGILASSQSIPWQYALAGLIGSAAVIVMCAFSWAWLFGSRRTADGRTALTQQSSPDEDPQRDPLPAIRNSVASFADRSEQRLYQLLESVSLAGGRVSISDSGGPQQFRLLAPKQIAEQVYDDKFLQIEFLDIVPTNQLLTQLVSLENLKSLVIRPARPNSLSLQKISQLEGLQRLEINAGSFPAADLVWLRKMLGLRELIVRSAERAHIDRICTLDQVVSLELPEKRFGSGTVQQLVGMRGLNSLMLPSDKLQAKDIAGLIDANPKCTYDFRNPNRMQLARFLVDLSTEVRSPEAQSAVDQMIQADRKWLFSNPSYSSFRAANWGHRGAYPHERLIAANDSEEIEEIDDFLRKLLDLNERVRPDVPYGDASTMLFEAALVYKQLGHLYSRSSPEKALTEFRACYRFLEQVTDRDFHGGLANAAWDVARHSHIPDEKAHWLSLARKHLADFSPSDDRHNNIEACWALGAVAHALRASDLSAALTYFEKLGQLITEDPENIADAHVTAWLEAASRAMELGDFSRAAKALLAHKKLMETVPDKKKLRWLRARLLGRSCALAIHQQDRATFISGTSELAAFTGITDGPPPDFGVWDFLSLRGWCQPLESEELHLQPNSGNRPGGDFPPVGYELAQGSLNLELLSKLAATPASGRAPWSQALRLRLESGQTPSAQQRASAAKIWEEQQSEKYWATTAVVAGLLGPTTEGPLSDLEPSFSSDVTATNIPTANTQNTDRQITESSPNGDQLGSAAEGEPK